MVQAGSAIESQAWPRVRGRPKRGLVVSTGETRTPVHRVAREHSRSLADPEGSALMCRNREGRAAMDVAELMATLFNVVLVVFVMATLLSAGFSTTLADLR